MAPQDPPDQDIIVTIVAFLGTSLLMSGRPCALSVGSLDLKLAWFSFFGLIWLRYAGSGLRYKGFEVWIWEVSGFGWSGLGVSGVAV